MCRLTTIKTREAIASHNQQRGVASKNRQALLGSLTFQFSTSLCSVALDSKRGFSLVRYLLFSLQSYIPNFSLISKFLNLMSPFMVLYLISFNFPFSVFNFLRFAALFAINYLFFHYNY